MSFFFMISIPFIFLGVFFAWHMATQYRNPIKLALGATVLTLYGGFIALGVSIDGENMKAIEFRLAGQLLLLFFSVIGGALVSIALNEIRKSSQNNSTD